MFLFWQLSYTNMLQFWGCYIVLGVDKNVVMIAYMIFFYSFEIEKGVKTLNGLKINCHGGIVCATCNVGKVLMRLFQSYVLF